MEIVGNKDANYLCLTGDCIELGQAFNSCREIEMHGFKQRKVVYQHRKRCLIMVIVIVIVIMLNG